MRTRRFPTAAALRSPRLPPPGTRPPPLPPNPSRPLHRLQRRRPPCPGPHPCPRGPLDGQPGSVIPTLDNAATLLQPILQAHCTYWRLALTDSADASPLDLPDGHYGPVLEHLARHTPTTVAAMSQAFTAMIAPLESARATSLRVWRNWSSCLT